MFSNYFKTAVRNICRHRIHSILNITGLAVGMACTIIILLWVRYEFSFDRYHENAERIYRLVTDFHFGTFQGKYAVSNNSPGPTLERDYAEVEKAVRFHSVWGISTVRYRDRQFVERGIFYADNTVFDVFTLPLLRGNPDSALATTYSVVITKDMAAKYFDEEDPLGLVPAWEPALGIPNLDRPLPKPKTVHRGSVRPDRPHEGRGNAALLARRPIPGRAARGGR